MRDAFRTLQAILLLLWPLTTWAAGASLGQTFGAITLADWLVLLVLSTVSGLVALLHRLRLSMEAAAAQAANLPAADADRVRIPWPVFALCHMAGALFTGLLAFLACEALDLGSYWEAAAIALASWSGAKVADKWADSANGLIGGRLGLGGKGG